MFHFVKMKPCNKQYVVNQVKTEKYSYQYVFLIPSPANKDLMIFIINIILLQYFLLNRYYYCQV